MACAIVISEKRIVAQPVVPNFEADIKLRLQRRAGQNARSKEETSAAGALGTEIAALFAKAGLDRSIRELRGYEIKPTCFD